MAERTHDTATQGATPALVTPPYASVQDLAEWAQRQDADLLILAQGGTGGTLVYVPGVTDDAGEYHHLYQSKKTAQE